MRPASGHMPPITKPKAARAPSPLAVSAALPRLVTASTWKACLDSLWRTAAMRYAGGVKGGDVIGPDGTSSTPPLSNAEVVAIVFGVLADMGGASAWPLWYQYAAAAYGWDPPRRDSLDVSRARGVAPYDAALTLALWDELDRLVTEADADRRPTPRLDLDAVFTDAVVAGNVRAALQADGAAASLSLPMPPCRDEQGRPTGATLRREGATWTCKRPAMVGPSDSILPLVLVVGALWLLASD